MNDGTRTPTAPEGTPAAAANLTPQEQQSVEVGQRGFTEPTGVNNPPPSGPQRPEYVPEKFWKDGQVDVEAMARSYGELERLRSQQQPQTPAEEPKQDPATNPNGTLQTPKADEAPAPTPLTASIEKARTEWASSGEVTEETVTALEQAGIPKEVFALYLEGVKAVTQQTLSTIHNFVGGEENYNAMAQWAVTTLNEAEVEAFNAALDNPQLRENAVRGLYARYTTARPSEGTLITPAGTPSMAGDVYTDRSQLVADQKDPRYSTDPTFRQSVMDKLVRSQRSGFKAVERSMFSRDVYTR